MRKITIAFFCWLLNICIVSCQHHKAGTKMEKYNWSPTECAPKNYPARIYSAYLVYEGGSVYVPSSAFINNGWGEEGSTHAVGEDFKPVPHRLELTWFSYTESKFYTGNFELPKEQMNKWFKEGYWHLRLKKRLTYNSIVVGMAPGGVVVVWLSGGAHQVEAGRYQAHDTIVSMHDFIPSAYFNDPKEYAEKILSFEPEIAENLSKKGIPYGLWDTYREKFLIRPSIELEDSTSIIKQLLLFYFNEEKEDITVALQEAKEYLLKPRIKEIGVMWEHNGKQYFSNLSLKEDEVFDAYKTLYSEGSKQAELILKINRHNDSLKLYLRNHQRQILLTPEFIETYQLSKKI